MKKLLIIVLIIAMITLPLVAFAHSGKTDSQGGHTDHSTGEYHYHHGYSAHQHTNGECPYDFDDKTDHSYSSSYSGTSYSYTYTYSGSYDDGYDDGYEKGRKNGYDDGYVAGENAGYDMGKDDWEKHVPGWVWFVLVVCAIVIIWLISIIKTGEKDYRNISWSLIEANRQNDFLLKELEDYKKHLK